MSSRSPDASSRHRSWHANTASRTSTASSSPRSGTSTGPARGSGEQSVSEDAAYTGRRQTEEPSTASRALSAGTAHEVDVEAACARTDALYRVHGRAVARTCRSLLRDRVEAEDAAQNVFLAAHRAVLAGVVPREPAAWLATIARHECWARSRALMSTPTSVGTDAEDQAAPRSAPDP